MDPFDRVVGAMRAGPVEVRSSAPIVLFHTHWEKLYDGWAIASRANARAMEMAGIDVRLLSWQQEARERDPEVEAEAGRFDQSSPVWDLHLFSSTLGSAANMRSFFNSLLSQPGKHAFQAMFERKYIEPELVGFLNTTAGVWTMCGTNYRVMAECGVKNITHIPLPYFDDDEHLQIQPPKEHKKFYWIGRFEPRKAPDNLIKAFMRTFKPGEAELTLKLSPLPGSIPYPSPEAVILDELTSSSNGWDVFNWRRHIYIIREKLSGLDMVRLHANNDVYVSASRGEGLDLPSYCAKMAGRTLLLTDSGGPKDFMTGNDWLVPATGEVDADPGYKWGPGATYNDYSFDALCGALANARAARPTGCRLPEEFRAEHVAPRFKQWIDSMVMRR